MVPAKQKRIPDEEYHGFAIYGRFDESPGNLGVAYSFYVFANGHQVFSVTSYVTLPDWVGIGNDRKSDEWEDRIISIGQSLARGRIDLKVFELGKNYEFGVPVYDDVEYSNLTNDDVQEKLLGMLQNVREATGSGYEGTTIDGQGFCLLLGIPEKKYFLNADELISKGYVRGHLGSNSESINAGRLSITGEGLKFLQGEPIVEPVPTVQIGSVQGPVTIGNQNVVNQTLSYGGSEILKELVGKLLTMLNQETDISKKEKKEAVEVLQVIQQEENKDEPNKTFLKGLMGGFKNSIKEILKNPKRVQEYLDIVEKAEGLI